ncbi:uncharacterized protein LOC126373851 [Pectinophora gossypiella]|uniref:uncharacterized protein LOC126373851 n=1 Tax=Pectinophora gossypiella TaxID=13191 RepID=UPI00214EBD01|nr:uncharacterized protein LOC126373851 [Pectinophora gossypiella]
MTTPCTCTEGVLVGIGNPLLDISANVEPELLTKYGLEPDGAIMAGKKHMPLYKELMKTYEVEFIAGGSVQNSLRAAQWILNKPKLTTYFGCVGDDDYAKILKDRAEAEGVNVMYQVTEEAPTGTCAVLVTGLHRSLCANLAAAQKFTPDHLAKEECKKAIETAKFFYASGFFVAVSPESIMQLAQHAHDNGHFFIMNLSAPFVAEFYKDQLEKLLPYVDVLFGNTVEWEGFAKQFGVEYTQVREIGLWAARYNKLNVLRKRVIVITQSANPVILVEDGAIEHIIVKKLDKKDIVDTNGAGDAFVGGFLSQMVLGKPYRTCVECGVYTARHVIQHSGCSFTGKSDFKESS